MIQKQKSLFFYLVKNDGQHSSSVRLLQFRQIIVKALPNMDRPHIIRLLFDSRHQSLIAYTAQGIIGGACFMNCQSQKFIQLAFFAVRAQKRIQGYGKKIMNKLKSLTQQKKINFILTYGDNMAIGFFQKQGFSQHITMSRQQWYGYIKQYDGGKLMQYKIHPTVDYININKIIQMQKSYLQQLIKTYSLNEIQFQGYTSNKKSLSTTKFYRKLADNTVQQFKRDPRLIPGIIQSGWNWDQYDLIKNYQVDPFNTRCKKLIDDIVRYPQSKYFLQPVSSSQVPNYYNIIKTPMDFSNIRQKISQQKYKNQQQICYDIELIFNNCMEFNHPESVYYKSASKLKQITHAHVQNFKHSIIYNKDRSQMEIQNN